ncbi:DUF2059 domain-containing protein [Sphingomonas cannabina]|uniref:DUF2059 domain-containing protein n=1 Tax=Sphingomonas cannabina TaxID=2899123 RepID=UPI001F19C45E|nr:DUF2059 domain-containing protein [Sphingomonas cannabina]UIJ45500.1 DUF2059 domain-containing protein [Sphingomonas cannabina]
MRGMTGALLVALATPAAAQTTAAPPVPSSAAATDPAKLALGQRIAGRLLPDGTYRTIMKATMDQVTSMFTDQIGAMPVRDLVKAGGLSEEQAAKLGPGTIRQIAEIMDPAFDQRMRITMKVMGDEMSELMTQMEPEYRAGLAEAYATRFSANQLAELDRFFATPTGSAYASQSMAIYADPAMMRRMQTLMPKIMQAMPGIITKVTAATADLPKTRDAKSLSKEERARLEALLLPAKDSQ